MKYVKHWQDLVNAVMGVALMASPVIAGFVDHTVAMTNAAVVGMALVAVSMGAMLAPEAWEEWIEAVLGLWMVVSPWVLGFSANKAALASALVAGLAILVIAGWTLVTDKDINLLPKSLMR